ncbi:sporadically distributed protein, TIGR04141 family [Tenacibaculum sp. MAR_2010_89]|uniref:DUF6119 family protein n=1 Tax=Tenacibaculum sp. MAR_2010_89 TaxID=1250198 RepID=UPI000895E27A|nr:DUF6119 family protein [Tenacibaculum sp. MAR_2010_89]SED59447.1 sporadically distributed protein, TIGR04141 family [Tenacibaculum sp. MAR_2010_89]
MNSNTLRNNKFELKIFKIDKNFHELKDLSNAEIIIHITDNYIKKLRHKFKDLDIAIVNPKLSHEFDKSFKFWSYSFNQPKEKFYWKLFLPDNLTENHDFKIVEFSYVLFIQYENEIYCIISGSGISVIKKYLHSTFGIEIYERISSQTEDNVIELNTRSIANNISNKKQTFNLNQTISETLDYSDIPTKIKLKVRKSLKENEFHKFKLDNTLTILEVGSYFLLRKKIDFEELKEMIIHIHNIHKDYAPKQLTLFTKIHDSNLIKDLDNSLLERIIDDVQSNNEPKKVQNEIIEIVHPNKLEKFYECDNFLIRKKHSQGKSDITTDNRNDLYYKATMHIFDNLKNINNRYDIKGEVFKLNIRGLINQKEVTYGNLYSHIIAEIELNNHKYFRIDSKWYLLEDKFLNKMNEEAKTYYSKYELKTNLLNHWYEKDDEDSYNKSHYSKGYYVLDKVIKDNVELCDLLVFKNDRIYFIHVKNGFDTKMRDLYIQVILSAKRLSNDLKNFNGSSYLKKTLKLYNERNPDNQIDIAETLDNIKLKKITISFVMAFKNNAYKNKGLTSVERIDKSNSNIAKYSIVQVVKEMNQYDFEIYLKDISEIQQ